MAEEDKPRVVLEGALETNEDKPGTSRTSIIVALISLVGVLGVAIIGRLETVPFLSSCTNISGTYKSNYGDKAVIKQDNSDCSIEGNVYYAADNNIMFHLTGTMKVNTGFYDAKYTDKAQECAVTFHGDIIKITSKSYNSHAGNVVDKCNSHTGWHEDLEWTRAED